MQIHRGLLRHALTGEGQKIPHDPAGALRLIEDDAQVLAGKLGVGRPLQQQLRQSRNRGQRIVELVRHAGDQLADGGHLVVLDDLGLEDALLGDVLDQNDDRPPLGVGQGCGGQTKHLLTGLLAVPPTARSARPGTPRRSGRSRLPTPRRSWRRSFVPPVRIRAARRWRRAPGWPAARFPSAPTTAIPSVRALNAVSHSASLRRTIS